MTTTTGREYIALTRAEFDAMQTLVTRLREDNARLEARIQEMREDHIESMVAQVSSSQSAPDGVYTDMALTHIRVVISDLVEAGVMVAVDEYHFRFAEVKS